MNGSLARFWRLGRRLAFPLYVVCMCGIAGLFSDVGHLPAIVYRLLGLIPPDQWLGRPLEVPFLLVGRGIFVLANSLLLGFYLLARLYIARDLGRSRLYMKVKLEPFGEEETQMYVKVKPNDS